MTRKNDACLACEGTTRIRPGEPKGSCPVCCRPESEVLASCLELLERLRIAHWRCNTGGMRGGGERYIRFGEPGQPDVLAVLPPAGRLLALECKSRTGRLRDAQRAWLERAEAAGAVVCVARSIDDLVRALRAVGIGG